jgi:hypothetical protein
MVEDRKRVKCNSCDEICDKDFYILNKESNEDRHY